MIFNSFFTQIVMAALTVGIIFTYVQPTFAKIGSLQEAIVQYQTESNKVNDVINTLSSLVAKTNNIPAADLKALLTYMPDTVDHVSVSRDLLLISEQAGAYLEGVSYSGVLASSPEAAENEYLPVKHTFSVNLKGTYDQTKAFLSLLEQNNYPLEVHELDISSTETGIISSEITIVTYSHS